MLFLNSINGFEFLKFRRLKMPDVGGISKAFTSFVSNVGTGLSDAAKAIASAVKSMVMPTTQEAKEAKLEKQIERSKTYIDEQPKPIPKNLSDAKTAMEDPNSTYEQKKAAVAVVQQAVAKEGMSESGLI